MRNIAYLLLVISFFPFVGNAQVATGQWTWMKGDNVINQTAIYGTQGIASTANKPGARQSAATWTDASGKFWLFGGLGYDAASGPYYLNDLWEYDPSLNQWTWVKGDNVTGQYGIYGTQGTSNIANKPGSREGSIIWVENGNLWLFGGTGLGQSGSAGRLNDLWKYNIATNIWTWMKGDNVVNLGGVYGAPGIAAIVNKPGGRLFASSWTDNNGGMWLFGGNGYDANNASGQLADLWKYDTLLNEWTWMKGNKTINALAVYGAQGVPAPANNPGARDGGVSWRDNAGTFWLFGGSGYDASSTGFLNDLWKYDINSNQWTWMKGDNVVGQFGIYGTPGTEASSNKPGGRNVSAGWLDLFGNLWLFGGSGLATSGGQGYLNDVWKYNTSSNDWTWIAGNSTIDNGGVYGTQGTPAAGNRPGSSQGSSSWIDNKGSLWLFGGFGKDASTTTGYLNNLWVYGTGGFVWTGLESSDWNVATNWSGNTVPGIANQVIIPTSTPFSLIIPAGTSVSCKDISVLSGATVTIQGNGNLNVSH